MTPIEIVITVLISCIGLAALILFVGGYVTYRMTFYHDPKKNPVDPYRFVKDDENPISAFGRSLIDSFLPLPYEDLYTTSHDGLKLHARLYMKDESLPFAIMCHGYKSASVIDFSGGGPDIMSLGYNGIMIDERATSLSEGKSISFGYNESLDILDWIEFVRKKWGSDKEIILAGVSMGAASVIMAAGMGLPENVKAVFADCPYSSAKEIITKVIYEMKLPGKLLFPLVRFGGRVWGGFDVCLAEPKKYIKDAKVPIYIVHGEADDFVPCDMSRELASLYGGAVLNTFPEAHHGTSYLHDVERYRGILRHMHDRVANTDQEG